MKIVIPGSPVPKHRPRYFIKRGKVHCYDNQTKAKDSFKKEMIYALQNLFDSDDKKDVMKASELNSNDAFTVNIVFYMPIPKSWTKYQKLMAVMGVEMPNKKPDLDNLEKFVLDCANGILFHDDAMVICLSSEKIYSKNPRTILEIIPMKKIKTSDKQKQILKLYNLEDILALKKLVDNIYELTCVKPTQNKIDCITKNIEIIAKDNCKKLKKILEFSKIKSITGEVCLR